MNENNQQDPVLQRLDELGKRITDLTERIQNLESQLQQQPHVTTRQMEARTETEPPPAAQLIPEHPISYLPPETAEPPDLSVSPEIPAGPEIPPLSPVLPPSDIPVKPPPPEEAPPPLIPHTQREQPAEELISRQIRDGSISAWEQMIGGKGAVWLGSVLVFLALAWILSYSWQFLGEMGRLGVGYAAGAAFLGFGTWAHGRLERWFGESLSGAGLGILYLSTWAGLSRYDLLSFETAFALMLIITVIGVVLALKNDSITLITLATLGGFLTPAVLESGETGQGSQALPLLLYILVLNAGILGVSLFKRWRSIVLLSYAGTVLLLLGWAVTEYMVESRWIVFTFISLYFLMFTGAACFYSLIRKEETAPPDILLLFSNAFVYMGFGYLVLEGGLDRFMGVFPFALFVIFLLLYLAVQRSAPFNRLLGNSCLGLALFFVTIAIPMQLKQGWIAVAWAVEAGVLIWLGLNAKDRMLQIAGHFAYMLSAIAVFVVAVIITPELRWVLVNERALSLLVFVLVTLWLAVVSHRNRDQEILGEAVELYSIVFVLSGGILIAMESFYGFNFWSDKWPVMWPYLAGYTIGPLLAVFGIFTYLLGRQENHPSLRLGGIVTALISVTVPVLVSLSREQSQLLPFWNIRILSYALVGASLWVVYRMLQTEREQIQAEDESVSALLPISIGIIFIAAGSIEIWASFAAWWMPGIPDKLFAAWMGLAIFYAVLGAGMLAVSGIWNSSGLFRLSLLMIFLASGMAVATIFDQQASLYAPFFNIRLLVFAVLASVMGFSYFQVRRDPISGQDPAGILQPVFSTFILLMILMGVNMEIYSAFQKAAFGEGGVLLINRWEALAWTAIGIFSSIAAAVSFYIAQRQNSTGPTMLKAVSVLTLVFSAVVVLLSEWDLGQVGLRPVLNLRFAAFLVVTAMAWVMAAMLQKSRTDAESGMPDTPQMGDVEKNWNITTTNMLGLFAIFMLLYGLTVEAYQGAKYYRESFAYIERATQMFVSLVWALYGLGLWVAGFVKNNQPLRLLALGLLGVTTVKLFLFDLSFLDTPFRILSFLVLGLVLLGIAHAYSRRRSGEAAE